MTTELALSGDLGRPMIVVACGLAVLSLALLAFELAAGRRKARASLGIALSGAAAVACLLVAVLRPVTILSKGSLVGPKVVVLVDGSRSIDLPGIDGTRRDAVNRVLAAFDKRSADVRLTRLVFGDGAPTPLDLGAPGAPFEMRPLLRSDLSAALEALARGADERPQAIVVVSDGRLDRPAPEAIVESTRAVLGKLEVPVHTVALAKDAPRDASIRAVKTSGAAVAHQPFSLEVEVGCDGGLECGDVPVVARELREEGAPTTLATGSAHIVNGKATIDLSMTIERAGARIVEVELTAPSGDTIPDNDRRYFTINVTRDRVRLLHVAGHPTYDVRALRMWMKSDASVDLVAFFILRTTSNRVSASADDLALIPFPVDELFEQHLPSFDAVVLQDFNAEPYGLTKHLKSLASYVKKGGGLIMVGGPDSFVAGNYARTPLAEVLPIELESETPGGSRSFGRDPDSHASDIAFFTPQLTEAGRAAPVLAPLRALIGDDMPEMPGTNVVGDARKGTTVLMTHPTRRTKSGAPMPVLALGEVGSGRTMALTIDGSHRLLFSAFAESAAGRAHGAFWDAMLGWLMRDPRFEPAVVEPKGGCIAGEESTLRLRPLPGPKGDVTIAISRLGSAAVVRTLRATIDGTGEAVDVPAGKFEPGGYSAVVQIGEGEKRAGPSTRRDFACERGGDEWADSRPDLDRLRGIATATKGTFVLADDTSTLPLPPATLVAAERHVAPILPAWAWSLIAAMALGAHWIVRRRAGLA